MNQHRRPGPHDPADGGAARWRTAARDERRLQALQAGILVALALVVFAVAALTGRGVLAEIDDLRVAQRAQVRLDRLQFLLGEQEAALWRHRALGGAGVPADVARTALSITGEVRGYSAAYDVPGVSDAKRRAAQRTVDQLDALMLLVATQGGRVTPGSDGDRRFLAALAPLVEGLKASADVWGVEIRRELEAANVAVESATRRIIALTGVTALISLLLGLLTWRLVSRSRRRMVEALRQATEQLSELADTDPLTGLANQRLLHSRLRDARAPGRPLSAVVLDLDHFKAVNDTHGHPVGDLVLIETARRLRDTARRDDLVARVGGEEFLMLLPDTTLDEALAAAERVRVAMRSADFPRGVGRLTASLGVATLDGAGDPDVLLERADAALYWAKTHGRDAAVAFRSDQMTGLSPVTRAQQIARADGLTALRALARAIDAKDPATQRHSIRVADMAVAIASSLGWTSAQTARLREAGLVHDVGKIGIPDAILLKPGGLTPLEREQMEGHARLSALIVTEVLDHDQVDWVAHHHERWDGGGYPDRIAGEEIPEGARILAVADCWDAMTSARSYRAPLTPDEALDECRRCAGMQLWPAAVEALGRLHAAEGALA